MGHGKKPAPTGVLAKNWTRAMETRGKPRAIVDAGRNGYTGRKRVPRFMGKNSSYLMETRQKLPIDYTKQCHGRESSWHGIKTLPWQRLKTVYLSFTNEGQGS